ncbi:HlyD family efflux transporter periplasmic adaptor subunit [Caballeronia sp. LZ029]|nr:HlyD family efflux transporter periplasmic adaptor subunit [Caballeronia sp. LZ029]
MRRSEAGIRGYEGRLAGLIADANGLDQQTSVRERLRVQVEEAVAAHSEIARLSLRAPFAGLWTDVDPQWRAGQWINPKVPVGVLIDPQSWQVDAFVKQDEVQRIAVGDGASTPSGRLRRSPGACSPSTPRACVSSITRCSRRATRGRLRCRRSAARWFPTRRCFRCSSEWMRRLPTCGKRAGSCRSTARAEVC